MVDRANGHERSAAAPDNPLLVKRFEIPFDAVRAEHVEPAVRLLLDQMRRRLADLTAPHVPRDYLNILQSLDRITDPLDYAMAIVRHLESVATYPELRAAYNAVQAPVSEFYSSIPLDPTLWDAVKAVNASAGAAALGPVERRFLDKTVAGFRRAGADLDDPGKRRLQEIEIALTEATTKFSENVLDATNHYELLLTDEAQLAGLPESARQAAQQSARAKGKPGWRFTLQGPSYLAVMTYLDDRAVREQMWRASSGRASGEPFDNRELTVRILQLRREKARLLGYRDFADLVLEERMAHTGQHAQTFLEDLKEKTVAAFREENESLTQLARELGLSDVRPWDLAYLAEKQRLALYAFDEEQLRPYFPLERVVTGMFELFGVLLNIVVREQPGVPGWDPAVRFYRVEDRASGMFLGGFYSDWYPRENKRGGAWMDSLITGEPDAGEPHLGLICGNLTPPLDDRPSLLTHREVETIFHEFGHLLHHVLSRVPVRSLAGTNVPWDFVELPSQIMENWCIEREALDRFARHYQTGAPIPEDLYDAMRRARNFRSANAQMRQLGLGLVDLKLHREYDPVTGGDVLGYTREIMQEFTPAPLTPDYAMIVSFSHLFANPTGYGAGYYSYKWAEVLDADAFTRFRREGIFNSQTGLAYRRQILERGDSDDPAALYRQFMGRDPDANALLERSGLLTPTPAG